MRGLRFSRGGLLIALELGGLVGLKAALSLPAWQLAFPYLPNLCLGVLLTYHPM